MPPAIAAGLVSLGVGAQVAGTLGSFLWTGILIGLSLLFAPKVPKPEAGHIPFKQAVPPRIRIIGQRRTAGAFMLFLTTPKGMSFDVQALCDGEANEIVRHYLHDDGVTVVDNTIPDVVGVDRYRDNRVRIYNRLGLPTETAYSEMISFLAGTSIDGMWTEDHRGDGIVSSCLQCNDAGVEDQGKRFPFGLPQYSAAVDATRVFDPRDEDQEWDDPATWTFSGNDNPILQAVWMLQAPISQGGFGLDFAEAFLPVLPEIARQADICDAPVNNKVGGGTAPRYRSDALYHYNNEPVDALSATLGAGDCFLAERGDGAFTLKAGQWDDDDFDIVFTDKHIISLHVRRGKEDENAVTGVIVQYNSRDHEHVTIDAPVWPRDAYQGGDDRRIRSVEIINCSYGRQAQRLGKRIAHYEQAVVSGTMVTKMYGILVLDRRGATIQCTDDPALADAKVRLTRVELNLVEGTVEIDFTVIDPVACDAWDAATEEGPLQPVLTQPPDDALSTPSSVTAVASQIAGAIYVDLSFDPGAVSYENVNYRVRWRIADIGGGVAGGWTQVEFSPGQIERPEADVWIVTLNGMPQGDLEFQIMAFRRSNSQWSVSAYANSTMSAPGRPLNFTATLNVADVDLAWDAPNSANMDHARVYRAISGGGFGLASDISGELPGGATDPMTYTDVAPATGTYDYWVVAENSADVASLARGPETVTVP